ncbi:MAG: cupin domain-containing protein [Chloroflexota bacterium]
MNTTITSKDNVQDPLYSPHGEIVYEMVGRPQNHGGAAQHSLAHIILPPGKASLAHHHRICEESYYILRGHARMQIDGRSYEMLPDQVCLIMPGQVHQIFNAGPQDLEFLAVCAPAWYPEDSSYESAA